MRAGETSIGTEGRNRPDRALTYHPSRGARSEDGAKPQDFASFGAVTDAEPGGVKPCMPGNKRHDGGPGIDVQAHAGESLDRPKTTSAPDHTDAQSCQKEDGNDDRNVARPTPRRSFERM